MANKSKSKGTQFESSVAEFLRIALDQPQIERRALHGPTDMGDVYRIFGQNGLEGIAECKDHRTVTDSLIDRWRAQTLSERDEAHADFGLLVIHRRGKAAKWTSPSFDENVVQVTIGDLLRLMGMADGLSEWEDVNWMWVSMTLRQVCSILRGEY